MIKYKTVETRTKPTGFGTKITRLWMAEETQQARDKLGDLGHATREYVEGGELWKWIDNHGNNCSLFISDRAQTEAHKHD